MKMLFLGHMKKWRQKNNRYATIKKAGIAMALPLLKNRAQKNKWIHSNQNLIIF